MQTQFKNLIATGIIFLSGLVILLSPFAALAESQKFAKGIVIYRDVGLDQPINYKGALFTAANPVAAWVEYETGQPKPLRLEKGQVVRVIDFANVFESDMITDDHLATNLRIQNLLSEAVKDSPSLSKTTNAVNGAIQVQIDKYRRDGVRYRGQWIDRTEYNNLMRQEAADSNVILERRKNLKTTYPPAAAVPLLADFEVFTLKAGTLNKLLSMDNVSAAPTMGLGRLDAALKTRSKQLPGSDSMKIEVGVYTSESVDGPAVLWAAREENLLALDIGICIRYAQVDEKLVNTEEIKQAKFFLTKYDDTLFETIVDALASAKIKAVLSPVMLSDNYLALQKKFYSGAGGSPKRESIVLIGRLNVKKGEFTMLQKETTKFKIILLIGKTVALNDGTMRQIVIVQLR